MKRVGTCRLCLAERPFAKAHIIPDFYYRRIREGGDKFYALVLVKSATGNENIRHVHSGVYDLSILCEECDNRIGRSFEDYASKLIFGGLPTHLGEKAEAFVTKEGIAFTQVTNVDYKKYKLFLLAILWRASVSTRPFFRLVSLGEHEEFIRKMLLEEQPGQLEDYPTLTINYQLADGGFEVDKIVGQPLKKVIGDKTAFTFIIFGNIVTYLISRGELSEGYAPFLGSTINPQGQMKWLHIGRDAMSFLARLIGIGNAPEKD